ncbi:MAG: autotransporter-associated beta strand repeat-containing protein, partial [Alphaproteobacteria bacterium]|nr:autotransporter-associated beta strand repeat-containing protein [Alphaproteobacteria bacterium]
YVDLTASNGARGTYFLDPTNITIYGNFAPNYGTVITGDAAALSTNLKLWVDASDTTNTNLTYRGLGTTASGTSGATTITVSANTGLVVGARIRLGGAGSVTAASTLGSDTYTITNIAGTTITLSSALTTTYTTSSVFQGYVSQLTDKSGLSNNAVQATAANMPLWISNGQNGLGVAQYNGSTNWLGVTTTLANTAYTNYNIIAVSSTNSTAGTIIAAVNGVSDTAGQHDRQLAFVSSKLTNRIWNTEVISSAASYNNGLAHISETSVISGSGQFLYEDGSLVASGVKDFSNFNFTSSGLTPAGYVIGSHSLYGAFNGNIPEILIYNTSLSANGRVLVDQYQSAKWAIALTPPGSGATEAAQATASIQKGDAVDGYSVFTTRYLERLSQSANISLQASNNITLNLQGDTLNFATAGRTLTLTAGNQITTASTGTITTNNAAITLNATNGIIINNAFTLNSAGGAININNATTLNAGLTINDGGSNNTIASVISGSGGLTKLGTGTLTLTGVNTYSGTTAVSNGTLKANVSSTQNALGSGSASIASGATLNLNNTDTVGPVTVNNVFSGAGTLFINFAAGTSARNTYVNNVSGITGIIHLSSSGATGDKWTINNLGVLPAALIIDSGSQMFEQGSTTFSGGITVSGTGNSETRGAIRLSGTLGGNIQLAGDTTIGSEGGTLTGAVTSSSASPITFTFGTANSNTTLGINGIISNGISSISLNNAFGTTTLIGANTYTGTTTVSAGSINLNGYLSATSGLTIASGAALNISGSPAYNKICTVCGSWTINGTLNNQQGTGHVAQTLPSIVYLNNGTIIGLATTVDAWGDFANSQATTIIATGSSSISGILRGSSSLTLNTALSSDSILVSASLGDNPALSLIKTGLGTVTLSGANTYTGTTTVSAGTLTLSGSWNVGAGTATTSVAGGATLNGTGVITAATLAHSGAG